MNTHLALLLICPDCKSRLVDRDTSVDQQGQIEKGALVCRCCDASYPVVRHIPRFVPSKNYADGFGFQWSKHATTQHDRFSGANVSERRFFEETRWPRNLDGQLILEIGCGSGRFTTHALSTKATVVSVDLSSAVDINRQLHAGDENLLVVQADLARLPFAEHSFDRVFCFGVLQHTPNVRRSFETITRYLKPGGRLAVDVYDRREGVLGFLEPFYRTYYWFRPWTTRMARETLYRCVSMYINTMWPMARLINRVPAIGRKLNRMLLINDYRGRYELSEHHLKEWAILDTFDNLSPKYDQRQTISAVRQWFEGSDLTDVEIQYGHNGIEARAKRCCIT